LVLTASLLDLEYKRNSLEASLLAACGVLPHSFREMRTWRNFAETQQSGHAPRSGLEIKNGRSRAKKWRAKEAQMRDSSEGGESNSAVHDRRHCKKTLVVPFSKALTE